MLRGQRINQRLRVAAGTEKGKEQEKGAGDEPEWSGTQTPAVDKVRERRTETYADLYGQEVEEMPEGPPEEPPESPVISREVTPESGASNGGEQGEEEEGELRVLAPPCARCGKEDIPCVISPERSRAVACDGCALKRIGCIREGKRNQPRRRIGEYGV